MYIPVKRAPQFDILCKSFSNHVFVQSNSPADTFLNFFRLSFRECYILPEMIRCQIPAIFLLLIYLTLFLDI